MNCTTTDDWQNHGHKNGHAVSPETALGSEAATPLVDAALPGQSASTLDSATLLSRMNAQDVARRDQRLIDSLKHHKMTAKQVLDYSKTWIHPFNNRKEVDRRIAKLGLRRFLRWKEDQLDNERGAKATFIKIVSDLKEAGWTVYDVQFEYSIPKAGIRCDCKFRARKDDADLLFLLEYENAEKRDKWEATIRKYREYFERSDERFRVLVVFRYEHVLTKVHAKAGEVMEEGKTNPTLFVFASDEYVMRPWNTATEKIWATHRRKSGNASLVSLVPTL